MYEQIQISKNLTYTITIFNLTNARDVAECLKANNKEKYVRIIHVL